MTSCQLCNLQQTPGVPSFRRVTCKQHHLHPEARTTPTPQCWMCAACEQRCAYKWICVACVECNYELMLGAHGHPLVLTRTELSELIGDLDAQLEATKDELNATRLERDRLLRQGPRGSD